MGNKLVSPIPTFEVAQTHCTKQEIDTLRARFSKLYQRNTETITPATFVNSSSDKPYIKKYFLPRLFAVIDAKKDSLLDFAEYASATLFLRVATVEEKAKVLFAIYEKNGVVPRENLKQLLLDCIVNEQREIMPLSQLQDWLDDQNALTEGMVDMALNLFSPHIDKFEFNDFMVFYKSDASLPQLVELASQVLETLSAPG